MARLLTCVALFWLLLSSAARAESASGVPEGYVQVFKTGKISVFAASRTGLSTEQQNRILKALKGLQDRYTSQYGLDKETYAPGSLKSFEIPKDTVELVIFPDLEKFQEWCGNKGAGGLTAHVGRHENVVAVPLENGDISAGFWWVLAHELSHVFFAHTLRLCGPIWLNEGLAEYFASTSKLYVATDHPNFKEMIERLDVGRKKLGTANRISEMIRKPQDEFGRQEYDEAWLLTHLLVTECSTLLNDLVTATREVETNAVANLAGVQSDVRKYAAGILELAFGGPDKLQAAVDAHLDELLKNPVEPAKIKVRPGTIVRTPDDPEIELRVHSTEDLVQDDDGKIYKARVSTGSLKHRAPWPATVTITIAVGDEKGKWSEEYLVKKPAFMKVGDKQSWEKEILPKFKGRRVARITAEWTVEGGGTYRASKVFQDK